MRKYRKIQTIALSAALTTAYAPLALAEEVSSEEQSLEVTEEPERIVSMGPNMTEILFALGAGDKLVGRTDYCDYPASVSEVESVGSISNADIEKILSLEPDLVLASTHFSDEASKQLEDAGVSVLYLYSEDKMEGVYDMISQVGDAVGCKEQAKEVVAKMQAKINYVSERLADADENPSAYYVVGYGEYGDYTAGGDTFVNGILTAAGADNVAADVEGWSYSTEKLLEKDPKYVITNEYNAEGFCTTDPYTELTAVKEELVYTIDTNMLDRQGPRNADAVVELAYLFHPECFASATTYPVAIELNDEQLEFEKCPESVYAASEELYGLLAELGIISEDEQYEEKTVDELVSEKPELVLADDEYSEEDCETLKEAGIIVVYADAKEDETVTLLGQLFDCNAKADELCYIRAALAE